MERKITDYSDVELQHLKKLYEEWSKAPFTFLQIINELERREKINKQKNDNHGKRTETIST